MESLPDVSVTGTLDVAGLPQDSKQPGFEGLTVESRRHRKCYSADWTALERTMPIEKRGATSLADLKVERRPSNFAASTDNLMVEARTNKKSRSFISSGSLSTLRRERRVTAPNRSKSDKQFFEIVDSTLPLESKSMPALLQDTPPEGDGIDKSLPQFLQQILRQQRSRGLPVASSQRKLRDVAAHGRARGRTMYEKQPVEPDVQFQEPVPRLSERHRVGHAHTIGRRRDMEDSSLIAGCFLGRKDEDVYAVFDGHGGSKCALYSSAKFCEVFEKVAGELQGDQSDVALQVLSRVFIALNSDLEDKVWAKQCGTTAVVAYFKGSNLYIANVGDTRAVLCRNGTAQRLSVDHKPTVGEEVARIQSLDGGLVINGRVQGMLSVTRALGDSQLSPWVSPEPFVTHVSLTPSDEFVILACDGVWDVITDEEAVSIIKHTEAETGSAQEAAQKLMNESYGRGSTDNITVLVIYFQ